MKRIYIPSFAALTLLLSCADGRENLPMEDDVIRFDVRESSEAGWGTSARSRSIGSGLTSLTLNSPTGTLYLHPTVEVTKDGNSSRSTMVDASTLQTFGVYATRSDVDQSYMANVRVTRANGWAPEQEYLWPGDAPLHFTAYSPWCGSPAAEGITSLPDGRDGQLVYVTPASVADQEDLLVAVPTDASASPCALTFNHALTSIRFVAGSEMAPCTVTSVALRGIKGTGTLDITDGAWTGLSGSETYSVTPGVELKAAEGSNFVQPGTEIAGGEDTFILIPQTLGTEASILLTIEQGGAVSTFEASLDGQTWTSGTTVTYRLSANPSSQQLILEITDEDGNRLSVISTPYTGGTVPFKVVSRYLDGDAVGQIGWKAEFIDASGNLIDSSPDWIVSFPTSGTGDADCAMVADLPEPIFEQTSARTSNLRKAADINVTSGHTPYNLSNPTGDAAVVNTANTYIISAPGTYSLPLVYGNAVTDGAKYTASYTSTLSHTTTHNRETLYKFINHLGAEISDPYIYNNPGCTPASAGLVWEDQLNLIRNISLTSDSKSLQFDIPEASIRQGNALVALYDKDGEVMWSWQIWVTDYVPAEDLDNVSYNGTDYSLYGVNLGWVEGGDVTRFDPEEVTVRFTQTDVPDGLTPLTVEIPAMQQGKTIATDDCYSFYQWGRKDPMMSRIDQFYNSEHGEMDGHVIPNAPLSGDDKEVIVTSIKNPGVFITTTPDAVSALSVCYLNLWNVDHVENNPLSMVKSIYDPCPVGAHVPLGPPLYALADHSGYPHTYDEARSGMVFTLPDGKKAFYPSMGYRNFAGSETVTDGTGPYWSAVPSIPWRAGKIPMAHYIVVNEQNVVNTPTNNLFFGYGLRPSL